MHHRSLNRPTASANLSAGSTPRVRPECLAGLGDGCAEGFDDELLVFRFELREEWKREARSQASSATGHMPSAKP